ncbi:MAG: hypothetical protein ABSB78_12510 [Bacteroidota bacterium]
MKMSTLKSILQNEDWKERISIIEKRLKKSVNSIEILSWLNNFEYRDWNNALKVLEALEYFSESEIIELYENRISKIIGTLSSTMEYVVHPIGEYGKSGTMMVYYFKKTPSFINNSYLFSFAEKTHKLKSVLNLRKTLLLLDDYLGTGKSANDYVRQFVLPLLNKRGLTIPIILVSLFGNESGIKLIGRKLPKIKIYTEQRLKAFTSRGSIFGNYKRMIVIRKFCYKYGQGLFTIYDPVTHNNIDHPLGYQNSQSIIVFPYGPPNNTLPIIWSSDHNWHPLYPRHSFAKINQTRRFRRENAQIMAKLLADGNIDDIISGHGKTSWREYNYATKTDFMIFAVILMKRMRRPVPIVCQTLGITETDYLKILTDATTRELLDAEGELTNKGEKIYKEANRIRRHNIQTHSMIQLRQKEEVMYIPKIFMGRS